MPDQPANQAANRPERTNPAVEAEPAGIGSSGAPDALSREVRLLGSLLGQVIAGQAGEEILDIVERVRKLTIDIRKNPSPTRQLGLRAIFEELPAEQIEGTPRKIELAGLAESKPERPRAAARPKPSPT